MIEYFKWTFEELGKNQGKSLDVEICIEIEPAEPATRDYPGTNARGYPLDVNVLYFDNETDEEIIPANGWDKLAHYIAKDLVDKNWGDIWETFNHCTHYSS